MKNQEIERKFLVNTPLEIDITQYRGKSITQGYVLSGDIKIDETLNELKINDTYVIYISETKKLVVKYIVKTNSVDYNDVI